MPGDDDLIAAAKSTAIDYYELLGITSENSSPEDIRRAFRRAALKYHPDKNADKPDIVQKFHQLQTANDVLSSPEYKAIYDNARRIEQEKEDRYRAFRERRGLIVRDLEDRENASRKRRHPEEASDDELQSKIQRLAADGKRRVREMQARVDRERLEEEKRLNRQKNGSPSSQTQPAGRDTGDVNLDHSIKVVWSKEGEGEGTGIDKEHLKTIFTTFGKIQDVAMLKEKKKRLGEHKSKSLVASALIVYESVEAAHAAVSEFKKRQQSEPDFKPLHSVYWASNKEPDFIPRPSTPVQSTTETPKSATRPMHEIPGLDSPITPLIQAGGEGGLRKEPSFASSSSVKNSPVTPSLASPSLEERTKIRLKNAEKRRLEEEIRKQEAEDGRDGLSGCSYLRE